MQFDTQDSDEDYYSSDNMDSPNSHLPKSSNEGEDSPSSDEEFEEWKDFDRNAFVAELLARDTDRKENMSKLTLTDESASGKIFNLITWLFYFIYLWKCVNVISDNALSTLLHFLYNIFQLMSLQDKLLAAALHIIPTSVYMLRKFLLVDRDNFVRYIVCPNCTKMYKYDDCFIDDHTIPRLLKCNDILRQTKRKTTYCNQIMFRKIILKGGDEAFYPRKVFCFRSLIDSLEDILRRPGYEELGEHWRNRETIPGHACDVYDGKVWQAFQQESGRDFLKERYSYGLQLNIDWFQPFARRKDISVGVIYMCLLNLPLQMRYKRENIFILGIIPALSKEPSTLQYFLQPVVKELKCLWKGVTVATHNNPDGTVIRAALLCSAADIPALRKICGFLGHGAHYGCSKCLKAFPGSFGEKRIYSGFERDEWPKRCYKDHIKAVQTIRRCKSKTARIKQERLLGWRYTPLMELQYFDSVTQHVIDPMHNLFLGTAKKMFKYWVEKDILTKESLKVIDNKLREFKISGDFGRLPNNISSNWGGFTAEQWKTWTLVYSSYVLHGVLPETDLKIWHTFVSACRKLVSPIVSDSDAQLADLLYLRFCKHVERKYGELFITPNMHMHCHLLDSVQNFGSVFAFWLFSFERFNGMLESYNTNGRENFEIQLMREFLVTNNLLGRSLVRLDDEHSKLLLPVAEKISGLRKISIANNLTRSWKRAMLPLSVIDDWSDTSSIDLCKEKKQVLVDRDDSALLKETYGILYPGKVINDMGSTILRHKSLHVDGQFYSSKYDHRGNYARIYAKWIGEDGSVDSYSRIPRPGTVKFYFLHVAVINGVRKRHCFASVDWLQPYTKGENYPNPITTWYKYRYFRGTCASFMPVQRIYSRFAGAEAKHGQSEILITCPLYKRMENFK